MNQATKHSKVLAFNRDPQEVRRKSIRGMGSDEREDFFDPLYVAVNEAQDAYDKEHAACQARSAERLGRGEYFTTDALEDLWILVEAANMELNTYHADMEAVDEDRHDAGVCEGLRGCEQCEEMHADRLSDN